MRRIFSLAHRIGAFALTVILSVGVSFLVFPVVISTAGAQTWAHMAVSQSVAALGVVVVSFGWGVTGPAIVAGMDESDRGEFYLGSLASRLWLFIVVAVPVGVTPYILFPDVALVCSLSAIASLLSALSGGWFFIGEARPWRLLLVATLPASIGTVLLCALLIVTQNLVLFVALQAALASLVAVICALDVNRRYSSSGRTNWSLRAAVIRLSGQTAGVVTAGTAALYVNGPLIFVTAFAPGSLPAYAMADRLLRYSRIGLGPVTQVAQGYVPAGSIEHRRRRIQTALIGATVVGVVSAAAFAALAPTLSALLSVGQVRLPLALTIALGVSLGSVAVSSVLGLSVLTSLGQAKVVAQSTVAGSILGVIAMLVLGPLMGILGIAIAVGASELFVLGFQLVRLRQAWRVWAAQMLLRASEAAATVSVKGQNRG